MKKKLLTILCLLMCILLLASCDRVSPDKETGSENNSAKESENLTDGMTEETQDDKKDDDPDNDYDVIIPDTEKPDATDSNTETEATESDTTVASDSQTESSTETVGETDHEHIYGEGTVIPPTFDAGGYTEYVCEVCGEKKQDNITDQLTHSYSDEWTFDEYYHWRVCTDEGYADLKTDEGEHTIKEEIVKDSTAEETGTLRTSCTTCTYYFDTVIPRKTHIVSAPTVDADECYVGMTLSSVPLIGGEGSVNGSFSWSYPDTIIAEKGDYEVTFTPSDPDDAAIKTTISISANWLKVNLIVGENGTAAVDGGNKVSYNGSITVKVEPKFGYLVDVFTVNGVAKTEYTIKNVKEDLTVNVSFKKSPNPVSVNCLIGNDGCYSISGGTLTITGITSNTVYTISGEAVGNIVIDIDPAYTFELELNGFKITSNTAAPISVINGDKVTISAKKSYTNYVIDNRDSVSGNTPASFPAAIYSLVDLDIEGKGILNVTSDNNGGIYTKKDVEVKNLTLSVNCSDNALRGNDSVEIVGGSLTLIATRGDAIRTNNSDISSKGNQRGNVTITGGVHNIYAAGDGISAAHDVIVSDATTTLNIFTDTYSTYTKLRTDVSGSKIYIRSETNECSYSLAFKTKNGYEWSDATYIGQEVIDGTTYHFYEAEKKSGYT
ncbi:MAG: carbohydrate-binding domain-containing protein, partial [Clostridia bacterium]|nr:carbohydrate-binding domain-containing protein [Clostridia bacterium]